MWLRVKERPKSLERDYQFSHVYAGKRWKIGPRPVKVPDEVGRYLLKSFSAMIEEVEEPVKKKK